jgi:2,4-dienoyl-CoA reductase-like NADH-dependent reductase (Old Yellow Enzyme family)
MTVNLSEPLTLPCGAKLATRIAKSAMSEGIADVDNHSTARLETLYRRWARSGAGLLFTGNIQVNPNHLVYCPINSTHYKSRLIGYRPMGDARCELDGRKPHW